MRLLAGAALAIPALLLAAVNRPTVPPRQGQSDTLEVREQAGTLPSDTAWDEQDTHGFLPGTYKPGTLKADTATLEDMKVNIALLARPYGDSVVLRWGLAAYPEWNYLTRSGVNILRHTDSDSHFTLDTLAMGLKPLTLEQFKARYPDEADSLAYMGMGAIYGTGELTPEQTGYEPGSIGSLAEIEQDQKVRLMMALLAAEWRADLADAMALRFVDHTARRGVTYSYYVVPTDPDTTGRMFIASGMAEHVRNVRYKPARYDVQLRDSITGHGEVTLTWNDTINGSFELYRRVAGTVEWEHVNEHPYIPPYKMEFTTEDVMMSNTVRQIGTYEYAVQAHDAFGDLTEMSAPLRVRFPDMMPPKGPEITHIVIDRPEEDPTAKIYADIHFRKDTMEADFVRYVPLYYSERDTLKQWRLLSSQYIAPTDTMARVDVTHISTGMVSIAAVDTADNMGYSFPRQLRVADMKPPVAPHNLRAMPALDGTVALMWDMRDTLDVHYYEVLYANAPDHEFTRANNDYIRTRSYTDSIATDANQRYIYYYVRAVDFATNMGESSDTIRVLRPNPSPPSRAHLDSAWVDASTIHMRWIGGGDEIIARYHVLRRRQGASEWTLLRVCDADSVREAGYVMQIDDSPEAGPGMRYEYAMETLSFWDVSSGLTPIYSALLRGETLLDIPVTLAADYDPEGRRVKLAWEAGPSPTSAPYFFCVYRKTPLDKSFRYLTDSPAGKLWYEDFRCRPGETVQYCVSIRFRDGRLAPRSNVVSVTIPQKEGAGE